MSEVENVRFTAPDGDEREGYLLILTTKEGKRLLLHFGEDTARGLRLLISQPPGKGRFIRVYDAEEKEQLREALRTLVEEAG